MKKQKKVANKYKRVKKGILIKQTLAKKQSGGIQSVTNHIFDQI